MLNYHNVAIVPMTLVVSGRVHDPVSKGIYLVQWPKFRDSSARKLIQLKLMMP